MSKVCELLRLSQECHAQARVTINPATKRALKKMGDDYSREADELQRRRGVIQAAFPKSDAKV
jgi:hypothetical protein